MAIVKTTWEQVLTDNQVQISNYLSPSAIEQLLNNISTKMRALLSTPRTLKQNYELMYNSYLTLTSTNLWSGLKIYMTSYKVHDFRGIVEISDKLVRYLSFYHKILTDSGLSKELTIARNYTDTSTSTGTNKGYSSDTPQARLDNFDDAIDFASTLTKDENSLSATRGGNSSLTTSGRTFQEQEKNMKLMYYNEIVEYINSIPNMLYSYYALDTIPYPEIISQYIDSVKDAW